MNNKSVAAQRAAGRKEVRADDRDEQELLDWQINSKWADGSAIDSQFAGPPEWASRSSNTYNSGGQKAAGRGKKTDSTDQNTFDNSGDDWFDGVANSQKMDGGAGVDTANYALSGSAVEVDLITGKGKYGDAVGDRYDSIENVHGSNVGDLIIGDEQTNRLVGRDGDDTILAGGGKDTLLGGRGADLMDGGEGVDTAEYDWSTTGVDVNLTTGMGQGGFAEGDTLANIENLNGSYHNDILTGDDGVNRLFGDDGDDVMFGLSGDDILAGGLGADTFYGGEGDRDAADYQNADAAVSVDLVNGGFGGEALNDIFHSIEFVYGSDFDDVLIGNDAKNRLVGGEGKDDLAGAGGIDYLLGGIGDDMMAGGDGNDVFELAEQFGNDTISDFEAGEGRTDRIWFRGLDPEGK